MNITDFKEKLSALNEIIYFDKNDYLREKTSDFSKLKQVISEGEKLLRNCNEDDKYFLYGTLGNLYRIYGQPEKAISFLKNSLEYAAKRKNAAKEIVSLIRFGEALKYDSSHEEALKMFNKTLDKIKYQNMGEYLDFVLQHKGKCLMELRKLDEAKECFSEALKLRESKGYFSLIDSTQQAIDLAEKMKIK